MTQCPAAVSFLELLVIIHNVPPREPPRSMENRAAAAAEAGKGGVQKTEPRLKMPSKHPLLAGSDPNDPKGIIVTSWSQIDKVTLKRHGQRPEG